MSGFGLGRVFDGYQEPSRRRLDDISRPFSGNCGLDVLLSKDLKKSRVAKRVDSGANAQLASQKSMLRKHKTPFWNIAPDGKTIQRLYDPTDEPIVERD